MAMKVFNRVLRGPLPKKNANSRAHTPSKQAPLLELPLHRRGRLLARQLVDGRFAPAYLKNLAAYAARVKLESEQGIVRDIFTCQEDIGLLYSAVTAYANGELTAHQLHMIHMMTLVVETNQRQGVDFAFNYSLEDFYNLPTAFQSAF